MATWKKVIVSGSNVSQLNNDAGYLTSATSPVRNAFATASYNGITLIADSASGSLNFASSSGQGLTISASAGNDTLTLGLSAIPNSSLANSSITIAGNSTSLGGTVTQAQILAGSGVWSGSAQLPSGIVSSSVLSSATQGTVLLTTNGVAGSTIDLGLETTDSPSFAGVTAGNVTVGITNDNTITTTTGDLTVNSAGGNVTIPGNLIISNNLTVQGTASFQNTSNLEVSDRFILMASGSNTTGDGGIVVQQATQNIGELFGWDSGTSRWALTGSFSANTSAFTPDAYLSAVTTAAGTSPAPASRYNAVGNIYVSSGDESIWIYS